MLFRTIHFVSRTWKERKWHGGGELILIMVNRIKKKSENVKENSSSLKYIPFVYPPTCRIIRELTVHWIISAAKKCEELINTGGIIISVTFLSFPFSILRRCNIWTHGLSYFLQKACNMIKKYFRSHLHFLCHWKWFLSMKNRNLKLKRCLQRFARSR